MRYKAEKVCHEEMVKMPLVDLKVLEDGSFRICMDHRKFSEIAIRNRYCQMRVHEEEILKSDFRTRYGHFEFTVMPFGLTKAPSIFMELMSQAETGESKMIGLEMEQETTKVVVIKERLNEAKDLQERVKDLWDGGVRSTPDDSDYWDGGLVIGSRIARSDNNRQKRHHVVGQPREHLPIEGWMMMENKRCGTGMLKLVVEIECFGMSFDEFDKETGSSDGLQPMQAGLSYVHALNEPHLHEIHVVPNKHEADQC
nr:putative reverse transcriptase domain, ribonuclease H-like domain, aspartic peptidase domain protein [Tanacetum cinerariifolium]